LLAVADFGSQGNGSYAQLLGLLLYLLSGITTFGVMYYHIASGAGKKHGHRSTDTARSSGYKSYFTFQAYHSASKMG
jgi:hypothetical protein